MKIRSLVTTPLCLLCHVVVASKSKTAEDFRVQGLDEIEPAFGEFQGRMYAGTLPITERSDDADDGELMFWLYVPDNCTVPDAFTIWLNGGPGCSSFGGMLFENAPVTTKHRPAGFYGMREQEPLLYNEYSWTKATTMLYVEQPAGTGFSSGPEPHDETDVARDFYNFLQNLYDVFSELREKRLFFFGESYAGYYVPSIAHKIHQENKRGKRSHINLSGIALGNGWINAKVQGGMVIDFAWWHGMIDTTTRDALHAQWEQCIKMDGMSLPYHSFTIPDECGVMPTILWAAGAGLVDWGSPNTYDVTTWDTYPMVFVKNGTFARFFNNPKVQDLLHAPRLEWSLCIPGSGRRRRSLLMLDNDRPTSMLPYMAELLDDAKIRVVVYNGDRDMSTCAQGSEILLDSMDWSGHDDWHDPYKARRGLWLVEDGNIGGYAKPLKNLDFVVVANSGHLAPANQPVNALDLLNRILSGKSFVDKELPVLEPPGGYQKLKKNEVIDEMLSPKTRPMPSGPVAFVAGMCGFILGVGAVLCYTTCLRKSSYERLGDVEV